MTSVYFVRHAQPDHQWKEDHSRPLTAVGEADTAKVVEALKDIRLDYACGSPYVRSVETIRACAEAHGLTIHTDARFREREAGDAGNVHNWFRMRWADFDCHEPGGESLRMVQQRNMEALNELLDTHAGENILLCTHGTALSTILNYYDAAYDGEGFLRIIDFMPYIVRLDFEGRKCVEKEELLIVHHPFEG